MAQPCPGGAQPKPGLTSTTVLLTLGALGVDILEHLSHIWPSLTAQTVWGRLDVATLCNQRPEDPGPPSAQDLAYTAILAAQATGGSLGGAYGSWAWKELVYQNFLNSCECTTVGETPPPRQPVPPPTTEPPYPTGPADQDPLTRIEHNQNVSTNGMTLLYNGLLWTVPYVTNSFFKQTSNYIYASTDDPSWVMTGEGEHTLPVFVTPTANVTDPLGIAVQLTTIPDTVKQRGTVTPRLYGVGSIYWDGQVNTGFPKIILGRESLHYVYQFVQAPPLAKAYKVWWRLMPGVQATGYYVQRSFDNPYLFPYGPYDNSFRPLGDMTPPTGWSEPPFYPAPSTRSGRLYALGAPP